MSDKLPEGYLLRCRDAGRWVSAFGITLLAVHLGLWAIYPGNKPFDLLEPVIFFLGRGVARGSDWSLRWGLVLVLTEGLSTFWQVFAWAYFVSIGLQSMHGLDLLGVEAMAQQAILASYVLWAGLLCWWQWLLLKTHPLQPPSRAFGGVVAAILLVGIAMAPLFTVAQRERMMGAVRNVEHYQLQIDERNVDAAAVIRGPDGWKHLGMVLVGEAAGEQLDLDIDESRSTSARVMLAGDEEVAAGSIMWREPDGTLVEIAADRDLDWLREDGALHELVAQWLAEREGSVGPGGSTGEGS